MLNFDAITGIYKKIAKEQLGVDLKRKKEGGSYNSDKALRQIQGRTRMLLSYFLASMEPEMGKLDGFLLVLGTCNLDEALCGFFTKYDTTSADLNPIGSFSKFRIREMASYFHQMHGFQCIKDALDATPTADLLMVRDAKGSKTDIADKKDMGLTYAELCVFGRLRKIERLGPVSMFDRMYYKNVYEDIEELAAKIKKFFIEYAQNRHKVTILPPCFNYDPESCDDNRYDMRPHVYATDWSYQFQIIDDRVQDIKSHESQSDIPATLVPSHSNATEVADLDSEIKDKGQKVIHKQL